jgi:basic membrane lipoprotein Med (substrate-binding protein (PBP1-ABC) superfamily)
MSTKIWKFFIPLAVLLMLLAACAPQATQTPPAAEQPAQTEKPAAAAPTKVNIGFIYCGPLDEPWSQAMIQAVERVKADPPHGLQISYKYFEKITVDEFEKFTRNVIDSGEYDIVWFHDGCAGADPIDNIRKDYPDRIFPVTASNYRPVGGNTYWIQPYAHEPAYLCGVIAGMMTKTNKLGMVSAFPYASVNHLLNAFIAGAKSVNPNVEVKNSYIESWWDPVKAKETALAQIEAGADLIYSERYGGHEAARDKGIYAFGSQADIHDLAPETVITSALFFWDPSVRYMIELWYDHTVNGTSYNAPADKPVSFLMKDGGSGLAPLYEFETKLPKEVLDKLASEEQKILDGTLVVPLNLEPVQ